MFDGEFLNWLLRLNSDPCAREIWFTLSGQNDSGEGRDDNAEPRSTTLRGCALHEVILRDRSPCRRVELADRVMDATRRVRFANRP